MQKSNLWIFIIALILAGALALRAAAQAPEVATATPAAAAAAPAVLKSPDGKLAITFQASSRRAAGKTGKTGKKGKKNGAGGGGGSQLVYSVAFGGKPLITESALGLELQGARTLGADVRIAASKTSSIDQKYSLVTGKASTVRDRCNALQLDLVENGAPGRKLTIEARAYDDAVAFRYIVPEQDGLSRYELLQEHTTFHPSKDAMAYALELPSYKSMYESEFIKIPVSGLSNQGGIQSTVLCGCPMLLDVPGVAWMAITEAGMQGNAAMYLVNPSSSWTSWYFESRISPNADSTTSTLCVSAALPHNSPWRVIMVGEQPGRLIESTVLTSLNPESKIKDTSWIKAGKAAWDWWNGSRGADGQSSFSTATMKYFVDFAAKNGLEYMLVDAGWTANGDITKMNGRVDIPELVKYAAPKNVKIWIWLGYKETTRQMEEAFALYEKWGVAGMKIDFIERDDQEGINFYYRTAECAARHHLMVDFHGSTKPSGMDRTWPNVMGYEGVLGMEQSKAGMRDNPGHHVMLPFTRMLAGRMDYTPGAFNNATRNGFEPVMDAPMVMGTRAQQLAMYVVYEAPIQMVSDNPAAYEGQPAFEFIKAAPATWDETKVFSGAPGEFIAMARRSGKNWFLGAMINWSPRTLDLKLDFLGEGKYTAEIYADAKDAATQPKNVEITKKTVTKADTLKAIMAPGGGYAVRLISAE